MQKTLSYLLIALALAACAHKIDIQQGNVVTQKQLSSLKTGMDRQKVLEIMGTPLVADPFHANRWDYFYSMNRGGELQNQYRVTLHFSKNRLKRFEHTGELPKDQSSLLAPSKE